MQSAARIVGSGEPSTGEGWPGLFAFLTGGVFPNTTITGRPCDAQVGRRCSIGRAPNAGNCKRYDDRWRYRLGRPTLGDSAGYGEARGRLFASTVLDTHALNHAEASLGWSDAGQ
jgi:hypothetical protein